MNISDKRWLFVAALLGGMIDAAMADSIVWADYQGQAPPKAFDSSPATYEITTDSNAVTFELSHQAVTSDMFTFSQWVIDRWPGLGGAVGNDFNVMSNANNDVTFTVYGYYGEDGAGPQTVPSLGDSDSYRFTIDFAQPVSDLNFQVNSVNALIKTTGFNSQDFLTIKGFLNGSEVSAPSIAPLAVPAERAFTIEGETLVGDFDHLITTVDPGQHVSDLGSLGVSFLGAVDSVELTMVNVATNPSAPEFSPGFAPGDGSVLQTWAFSVGDVNFTTGAVVVPEPSSVLLLLLAGGCLGMRRRRKGGI